MKVSIITVCYNSASTIEKTILSVIRQSYKNIEYIIIDGGSVDGTVDILKKYNSYIHFWRSEPDRGIYDAMNKGLKHATGDIIGFINSDDWYLPNALEDVVNAFAVTSADVVYGNTVIIDDQIGKLSEARDVENIYQGMCFCHQSTFVKKDCFQEREYDLAYKIASDYEFLANLYLEGKKFHKLNMEVSCFCTGGVSTRLKLLADKETDAISNELFYNRLNSVEKERLKMYRYQRNMARLTEFLITHLLNGDKLMNVNDIYDERKYIIYGSGKMGGLIAHMLKKMERNVVAFWDNNTAMNGKKKMDIPIVKPYNQVDGDNVCIIISSFKYEKEMSETIRSDSQGENVCVIEPSKFTRWLAGVYLGVIK